MNLRQLECFLAVADELHFRRAAERLHVVPASVSEAVASRARRLGGRVGERTSRRGGLTPRGPEFAASIRQPLEELYRAHRAARLRSVRHRDVVIAHTPELGQLLLTKLAGAAVSGAGADAEERPPWRPVAMHTPEQLAAVADGEIDIGLCWSVPDQPGISSTVLGEFPLVAVLRLADPLARLDRISLTDLRSRRLLITPRTDNPYLESQFRAEVMRAGIPDSHIEEVARYDELVVHVATRGHVGVHPGPIAVTSPLSTVVFRPIADALHTVRICAVTHVDALSPPVDALIRTLREIVHSVDVETALTTPGRTV